MPPRTAIGSASLAAVDHENDSATRPWSTAPGSTSGMTHGHTNLKTSSATRNSPTMDPRAAAHPTPADFRREEVHRSGYSVPWLSAPSSSTPSAVMIRLSMV